MQHGEIWQLIDGRSVGGIERHVCELVRALTQAGRPARAVLLSSYRPHGFADLLRVEGIPSRVLDGTVMGLVGALRRHRPSLLHTHGYKAGIVGRFCARLLGIPVVSSFHAGEKARWPVGLYQQVDALSSVLARRISVSREIAERLILPSQTIDNFVSLPAVDLELALPRRVAFVGRLSHEKGPDLFCEIARACGPGLQWHVFGDGPMRRDLEQSHGEDVIFHGHAADMSAVWPRIGLLVMPSRAEGLPMAALEAMARGIPVAASDVGGLPALLKPVEPQLVFPAGNVAAARATVRRWQSLTAHERSELRHASRRRIEQRYSPAAILPKIVDVYRSAGWEPSRSSTTIVQSSDCSSGSEAATAWASRDAASSTASPAV